MQQSMRVVSLCAVLLCGLGLAACHEVPSARELDASVGSVGPDAGLKLKADAGAKKTDARTLDAKAPSADARRTDAATTPKPPPGQEEQDEDDEEWEDDEEDDDEEE